MQKLLLQCSSLEDAPQLKSYLESRLPFEVLLSFGKYETENIITRKAVQLFIYDTAEFDTEEANFLSEIRNLGYIYPMLVLAKNLVGREVELMSKFKAHFLEKPLDFKALRGVTRKLMTQKSIASQKFKRFKTLQEAQVETYLSAESLSSKMFNLSKGGVYCEFSTRPSLSVGDIVKIQVPLKDLSRSHQFNAKVVWTTRKGSYSGGFGAGFEFVKSKDVYRHVMEKL